MVYQIAFFKSPKVVLNLVEQSPLIAALVTLTLSLQNDTLLEWWWWCKVMDQFVHQAHVREPKKIVKC